MEVLETVSVGTLDARLRWAIEAWCARENMGARAFGTAVLRDHDFVASLGRGRSPRLATADRALAFMGEPPAGPAFRREVGAFLAVTGVKRSLLGREATGNPSFVAHLRQGVSSTLATVEGVRAWMAGHASVAELRETRARAGVESTILSTVPLPRHLPPPESARRSAAAESLCGPTSGTACAYLNTVEAAQWLGLSPRTLDRYRGTGSGSVFQRFGGCVRYRREDLEAWAVGRRLGPSPEQAQGRTAGIAVGFGVSGRRDVRHV